MAQSASTYQQFLSTITNEIFIDTKNIFYQELTNKIDDNVLEAASKQMDMFVNDITKTNGLNVKRRPKKTLGRINIKKQRTVPDIHFKVNSDLCAFTINCDIDHIYNTINMLKEYVEKNNGFGFIRNDIWQPDNLDIIAYYFCYIPEYGFIMEFQIGHPFASYTFKQDSAIRDGDKTAIDLWCNNFYSKVKNNILGFSHDNLILDLCQLYRSYGKTNIDIELLEIIAKIKN